MRAVLLLLLLLICAGGALMLSPLRPSTNWVLAAMMSRQFLVSYDSGDALVSAYVFSSRARCCVSAIPESIEYHLPVDISLIMSWLAVLVIVLISWQLGGPAWSGRSRRPGRRSRESRAA